MTKILKFINPCEMPCAKCGSTDAHRRHYVKGETIRPNIGQGPCGKCTKFVDRGLAHSWRVQKECIVHHCRCCGYEWDTAPMSKS